MPRQIKPNYCRGKEPSAADAGNAQQAAKKPKRKPIASTHHYRKSRKPDNGLEPDDGKREDNNRDSRYDGEKGRLHPAQCQYPPQETLLKQMQPTATRQTIARFQKGRAKTENELLSTPPPLDLTIGVLLRKWTTVDERADPAIREIQRQ
jgi:hypothetical protein